MVNRMIKVSIMITLYNKEQWFERCFDSIVRQTYKNMECIIVDDCSTDKSLELAERLVGNYTGNIKFVVIKHAQNCGVAITRNTCINNSNGEYLYFLDADDEITENCINSLVLFAQKYPSVDIVQGNMYQYPRVENDFYELKGKLPEFVSGNLEIKRKYSEVLPVNPVNKLFRKKFITQNYLYYKEKLIHEDFHWHFFMMKKIGSFAFTEEYCYIRYYVPDSIMTTPNLFPSISSYLIIVEDILSNLDVDLLEQQLKQIRVILNNQKKNILSDEKYSSLMPKCKELLKKTPNKRFFAVLIMREITKKIKQRISSIVNKIFR